MRNGRNHCLLALGILLACAGSPRETPPEEDPGPGDLVPGRETLPLDLPSPEEATPADPFGEPGESAADALPWDTDDDPGEDPGAPPPRDVPAEADAPEAGTGPDGWSEDPGPTSDAPVDAPPDNALPEDLPATDPGPEVRDIPDPPPPACSLEDPCPVPRLPFVTEDSTQGGRNLTARRYDCAPSLAEEGPERVFRLALPGPGALRIEVQEASGVDVDVHLLRGDARVGPDGTVSACLARADRVLSLASVGPGEFLVAVDTYGTAASTRPGAFRLAIEHEMVDVWQEVPVAPGVLWRRKTYRDLLGGRQTVQVLEVRPTRPEVTLRPFGGRGSCTRPSEGGRRSGAIAAINGGFYDPSTCASLSLVQIDGQALSANGVTKMRPHATWGLDPDDRAVIAPCTDCRSWPEMRHALGAYPNLVTNGTIDVDPFYSESLFTGRHPRTGIGLRSDGTLLLVVVDGRTEAGVGMTLRDFAQYFLWLGAQQAANLDGGGSSTLWIEGMSLNGIVNHPSDNGVADHLGERAVANGLLVLPASAP